MSEEKDEEMGNYLRYSQFRTTALHLLGDSTALKKEYNLVRKAAEGAATYKGRLTKNTPEMSKKNRYMNVITLEDTRVKLESREDDYINASFIRDKPSSNARYIATQGPLPNTFTDFWRMCWEQKTEIILMLSPFREKGQCKVHEYLPLQNGQSQGYGKYKVTVKDVSPAEGIPHCVLRQLEFQLHTEIRRVMHIHFTGWPDFGTNDGEVILKLVDLVAAAKRNTSSPIVTHCSAGVGRTGTFIAIDEVITKLRSDEPYEIDIPQTVVDLRNQRPLMVMTPDQYGMIYSVVYHYLFGKSLLQAATEGAIKPSETDDQRYNAVFNKYL